MTPSGHARRRSQALAGLALASIALAACSSSSSPASTTTSSPAPGRTPAGAPLVSFVTASALAVNGTVPQGTAAGTCGSPKYGWISELAHVSLSQARVKRHWAAFVPTPDGLGAKQMEASGSITSIGIGATDVPFDHPFGGDMSFDEHVDQPYVALDQNLGPNQGGNPPDTVHDELMAGLVPHAAAGVLTPGVSWPDYAQRAMSGIAPGFVPQAGDRVAVMGSWVVDCGHTDFHSELHSITFMAFGHREGDATVAHAFYNPYEVAQVFNPDPSLSGKVDDPGVLTSSASQDVLHFLVTAIIRLASGADRQATAPVMLEPNTQSPTPWTVCAPAGTSGHHLAISYDFSIRPGVSVFVEPDRSDGCATVSTTLTGSYRPPEVTGQQLCPTAWSWLDKNAFGEAGTFGGTGNAPHDIPTLILQQVGHIAPGLVNALRPKIGLPLQSVCFEPLVVDDLSSPSAAATTVTTVSSQLVPLAGWVRVAWAG
jgi:hypothetical protein